MLKYSLMRHILDQLLELIKEEINLKFVVLCGHFYQTKFDTLLTVICSFLLEFPMNIRDIAL
jgi:hypothetical protein